MERNIVFYMSGFEDVRLLFEKEVVSIVPQNLRTICSSLKELSAAIRRQSLGRCICVVLTGEKSDLLDLFSIRDLLRESKLILVLHDDSDGTIELGHKFFPRFSNSINNGFENTAAVLAKMLDSNSSDE